MVGDRHDRTDTKCCSLKHIHPTRPNVPAHLHDPRVMNRILSVMPKGIPRRSLLEPHGPYSTCCNRWRKFGDWSAIRVRLPGFLDGNDHPDWQCANSPHLQRIEFSVVCAHHHPDRSFRDDVSPQLGRSRGGSSANIHLVVDGNGQIKPLVVMPSQNANRIVAEISPDNLDARKKVRADMANRANAVFKRLDDVGATNVIRSRFDRTEPRVLGPSESATCSPIGRFSIRVNEFWRVATRNDRRVRDFLSTVCLAARRILIRGLAKAAH